MKKALLVTAAFLGIAGSATAEGLSFGADVALGLWGNNNGGSGIETNGGISGTDTRLTGKIGLSAASDFGLFVGQIDIGYQKLEATTDGLDQDDTTDEIIDVTLRGMRDFGAFRGGLFLGYGTHNDNGDSDDAMGFYFVGLEASAPVSFGEVFGQVGHLDSFDEFDEGTQEAPFIRVGATYDVASDLSLTGAISYAGGVKYGDAFYSNSIFGLELGLEKAIRDTGLSVYTTAEFTRISYSYPGNEYGDEFGTLWVGLKYNLGGDTKRGGKLPNFGQWVAYNANEIE